MVREAKSGNRRAASKSHGGCANCKLCRVKCDEGKPNCKRCDRLGLACKYQHFRVARRTKDLTHVHEVQVDLCVSPTRKVYLPIVLPVPGQVGRREMQAQDLAILDHFEMVTALTLGNPKTRGRGMTLSLELSTTNPFLLHCFNALALMHRSYLNPSQNSLKDRQALASHWYHGTVLLNRLLSQPAGSLSSSNLDALWAGAALLSIAAFAYIETSNPHEAWPLNEASGPQDLDWLKMGRGKAVVHGVARPDRRDSVFFPLIHDMTIPNVPNGRGPVQWHQFPLLLASLFGDIVDDLGGYHVALSILSQVYYDTLSSNTMHRMFAFAVQSDSAYHDLLARKDSRALLLLLYWYAKVATSTMWWHQRRSIVQGWAIYVYLKEHEDDQRILALLEYPKDLLEQVMPLPDA